MSVQRSKPYPSFSLQDAVSRIQTLKEKAGIQQMYSKEIFAQGIGYKNASNGAFIRAVAALIQYNLVIRDGDGFALTSTARNILIHTTEAGREHAIRDAALSPDLFRSAYDGFKGDKLPALLPNILVQQYGILDGAKNKAHNVFIATMEFAGLLQGDMLLDEASPGGGGEVDNKANREESEEEAGQIPRASTATVPSTSLTKDFGEGRVVSIVLPNNITDDERSKIVLLIQNM